MFIQVLRANKAILPQSLVEQTRLDIAMMSLTCQSMLSILTAQVLLAYIRTLYIQALYVCPLTFSGIPQFANTGSKLWIFFQANLYLLLLQNNI